ncbi:MAG TPA: hypothetical protein VIK55_06495 [Paludibacter sp.]
MKEIIKELLKGSAVIIDISDLPEFFEFTHKSRNLYAFWYSQQETTVTVTIDKENTILRP